MIVHLATIAAFAEDPALPPADLAVVGTVKSVAVAEPRKLYDVARTLDFAVMLAPTVPAQVCVEVSEVLAGDLFGDEVCFLRVNGLALSTWDVAAQTDSMVGRQAVFLLREGHFGDHGYFADRATALQPVDQKDAIKLFVTDTSRKPAPPAPITPPAGEPLARQVAVAGLDAAAVLRARLQGTPEERKEAFDVICDYGMVPLVPDVIAAIDDKTLLKSSANLVGTPVGTFAAEALGRMAPAFDGQPTRPPGGHWAFGKGGLDHATRAGAVKDDWTGWWASWRTNGPPATGTAD